MYLKKEQAEAKLEEYKRNGITNYQRTTHKYLADISQWLEEVQMIYQRNMVFTLKTPLGIMEI